MIVKFPIEEKSVSINDRLINIDLLNLPYATIHSLVSNGSSIDKSEYTVVGNHVKLHREINEKDLFSVFLEIDPDNIKNKIDTSVFQRNAAIVVALIGLLGTVVTAVLKPEIVQRFFSGQPKQDIVIIEPDTFGADRTLSYFQSIVRWDRPSEKNYAFPSDIFETHKGWYFVRLRENLVDIRESQIENVVGPIVIKNGNIYSQKIPAELKKRFCASDGALQMIMVALPDGMRPSDGSRIADFGENAKVLLSAASGSKEGCAET